jgi:Putative transposase
MNAISASRTGCCMGSLVAPSNVKLLMTVPPGGLCPAAVAALLRARGFLLHVLPDGFHRIRNYGLLANGHRAEKLALCRKLLDVPSPPTERSSDNDKDPDAPDDERPPCPCCGGRMQLIESFRGPLARSFRPRRPDTS